MKWLYVGITGLFLIVVQTVLLPGLSSTFYSFDLTIVLIVYISLHFSHYLVVAAVACIGGIMDSLSGAPFFLYTFSYIWIYLLIQGARRLVFQTSVPFVMTVSLLSVMIEQGIFLFSLFARQGDPVGGMMNLSMMMQQMAWGGVMIPVGVGMISAGNRYWQNLIQRFVQIREKRGN